MVPGQLRTMPDSFNARYLQRAPILPIVTLVFSKTSTRKQLKLCSSEQTPAFAEASIESAGNPPEPIFKEATNSLSARFL